MLCRLNDSSLISPVILIDRVFKMGLCEDLVNGSSYRTFRHLEYLSQQRFCAIPVKESYEFHKAPSYSTAGVNFPGANCITSEAFLTMHYWKRQV